MLNRLWRWLGVCTVAEFMELNDHALDTVGSLIEDVKDLRQRIEALESAGSHDCVEDEGSIYLPPTERERLHKAKNELTNKALDASTSPNI